MRIVLQFNLDKGWIKKYGHKKTLTYNYVYVIMNDGEMFKTKVGSNQSQVRGTHLDNRKMIFSLTEEPRLVG